jgi:hypothetical protein
MAKVVTQVTGSHWPVPFNIMGKFCRDKHILAWLKQRAKKSALEVDVLFICHTAGVLKRYQS